MANSKSIHQTVQTNILEKIKPLYFVATLQLGSPKPIFEYALPS
jgi:hypothetical protein